MSEEKITVIVPMYNVERYLRQCLDSIVNQTYKNLEILLIDDGSPDKCGEICDEYSQKDMRIRVTHKKNGGLSAAWNDGLEMATGDWIAFVDSDDWLDLDYFETLLANQETVNVDVVQSGGYYWEEQRGQFIRWAFIEPFIAKNQSEKDDLKILAMLRASGRKTKGAIGFSWGKLFRRQFLEKYNLSFDTKIRAGLMMDVLFNWDAFERASAVLGVVCCGYHYRITQTSGTYKFDPNLVVAQEHVQEQFFQRVSGRTPLDKLNKAFESRCLRDIVHNLQRCFFHPDNPASRKEVAIGIHEMKQMPYYRVAIASKDNPYNGFTLKMFQLALRLPWIWPLRCMVGAWNLVDRSEQKA